MPIVFVWWRSDGAGLVESLSRPGGNTTGFINFEYGIGGKWLELLKEISPGVTRAAVLRDPTMPRNRPVCCHPGGGAGLGIEVNPINLQTPAPSSAASRISPVARMEA